MIPELSAFNVNNIKTHFQTWQIGRTEYIIQINFEELIELIQ